MGRWRAWLGRMQRSRWLWRGRRAGQGPQTRISMRDQWARCIAIMRRGSASSDNAVWDHGPRLPLRFSRNRDLRAIAAVRQGRAAVLAAPVAAVQLALHQLFCELNQQTPGSKILQIPEGAQHPQVLQRLQRIELLPRRAP